MIEDRLGNFGDDLSDPLGNHNTQMGKHNDLFFHRLFKSLLSISYQGTPEEKIATNISLGFLIEHIANHPSILNNKIIQCELPNMMIMEDKPI
jgi:hypothetical protein